MKNIFIKIYEELLRQYGCQGWWPINGKYHPKDYRLPNSRNQVYETCIGAILTQSIGWASVEKALGNLKMLNVIDPEKLMKLDDDTLKQAIKPAGYFNQKARKLREFTKLFITLNNRVPSREQLLNIWGIGNETADSMLLYAFKVPTFVVDSYTKRIFIKLKYIPQNADYNAIKGLFERNLPPNLIIYQEYHAMIVEHAKRYYTHNGDYHLCPLYKKFAKDGRKLMVEAQRLTEEPKEIV